MADRFRKRLSEQETGAVGAMADTLRRAEEAIGKRLDALDARIAEAQAAGEPVNAGWLRQQGEFRQTLIETQRAYAELTGTADTLAGYQREAATVAASGAGDLFTAALGPVPAGVDAARAAAVRASFRPGLGQRALAALTGFASDGSPLRAVLSALGPDAERAMEDALIDALATGRNPREAARGVTGLARNRAETIARTETLRAAREATRQVYEANGDVVEGWVWLSAADIRSCACCWAMSGKVFPTSEKFGTHPSCRCALVPKTKSWAELTGDDSLDDTRAEVTPGPELFASLSEEQQRAVLGDNGLALYQAGTPLGDWVHEETGRWGLTRRPKTPEGAGAGV